jgi:hypothetical protein
MERLISGKTWNPRDPQPARRFQDTDESRKNQTEAPPPDHLIIRAQKKRILFLNRQEIESMHREGL